MPGGVSMDAMLLLGWRGVPGCCGDTRTPLAAAGGAMGLPGGNAIPPPVGGGPPSCGGLPTADGRGWMEGAADGRGMHAFQDLFHSPKQAPPFHPNQTGAPEAKGVKVDAWPNADSGRCCSCGWAATSSLRPPGTAKGGRGACARPAAAAVAASRLG